MDGKDLLPDVANILYAGNDVWMKRLSEVIATSIDLVKERELVLLLNRGVARQEMADTIQAKAMTEYAKCLQRILNYTL